MKKVFIGSSSKALEKAHTIQQLLLELHADAVCWQDAFPLSHNTIDDLIQASHQYNAGVFIFDLDDQVVDPKTGDVRYIPRDNVLVEAGMFAGVLGKESVVLCTVPGVHETSDFKGMTTLPYDPDNLELLKNRLRGWLDYSVRERKSPSAENNVLMLPRHEVHARNSIDSRFHFSDGLYKKIRRVRIMNLASNLLINPEFGETGCFLSSDISLSEGIELVLRDTRASVELMLAEPNQYNLLDLETKIANRRAGSAAGILYSALATMYEKLSTDTIYSRRSKSVPVLFQFSVMKTSLPFGILNVEFQREAQRLNYVQVDLYSAALDNEDNRRSFLIWQEDDPENYQFFVNNFNAVKNNPLLCEVPSLETMETWARTWRDMCPGGAL